MTAVNWATFAAEAPDVAQQVLDRFTHHKHALLATLRSDGSPRISGIEIWFRGDDAWLGMMPNSAKGADLDRDPRFELHSAPIDLDLREPDARIRGRAVRIEDAATITAFAATLPHPAEATGALTLYRLALSGAVLVAVDGDELVIHSWRPGRPPRRQSRR